jgi:acetyl-CoA carboxylase carboxyl transferase subunit beta
MDFAFIGGSMGAVVGEKSQEESIILSKQIPFIMISKSGGARMMEAAYFDAISKTSVNLPSLLRKNTLHFTVQTLLLEERLHLIC